MGNKQKEMDLFIEYLIKILPKGNAFLPLLNEDMVFNWFNEGDLIIVKAILDYNEIPYEIGNKQYRNSRLDIRYSYIQSKLRNDKIDNILK